VSDLVPISKEKLTPAQHSELADVPPEIEWLGNITNKKTRRAYKNDVQEFVDFSGPREPSALRTVARSACHRLAQASGVAGAGTFQHPPQAVGAFLAL
jgi:hypothetical protein